MFEIETSIIDEDIVKSAERWLQIKNPKYRTFCPFILKHAGCSNICGKMIKCPTAVIKDCPMKVIIMSSFTELVDSIVKIHKGTLPSNEHLWEQTHLDI